MKLKGSNQLDLHIHSTGSDGTWTKRQIVERVKESGVSLFTISDHDKFSDASDLSYLFKEYNLKYLKGIEISSTYNGSLNHILAFGVDTQNQGLRKIVNENAKILEDKDDNSIKHLIKNGYNIDFQEYLEYKYELKRGGWKALNFLIDKGYCENISDYFSSLFSNENKISMPEFTNSYEVIKRIKAAGGVAILAHPYYVKSSIKVDERLGMFKDLGVDGIECYHPNHAKETIIECYEWCKKNDMLITAGSDCHGDFIPSRKIGFPKVTIDQVKLGKIIDFIYS
ncbi:PHP domain-containing protein [Clostridium sp. DL1XJH146]